MTTLAQIDLWGPGSNRVVTLAPGPDDLFVIVMLDGKVALNWPITEYQRALRLAHAFTRRLRVGRAVTIKVLSLTEREACTVLGIEPATLFADQTAEDEAAMRQAVVTACQDALRTCPDARVRSDALKLLTDLGAM